MNPLVDVSKWRESSKRDVLAKYVEKNDCYVCLKISSYSYNYFSLDQGKGAHKNGWKGHIRTYLQLIQRSNTKAIKTVYYIFRHYG